MITNEDQIIEEFYKTYNNDLYYIPAEKTQRTDPNKPGKVIYDYNKKKQPITKSAFIEHLTTGSKVVTIGQLNKRFIATNIRLILFSQLAVDCTCTCMRKNLSRVH
jgi:hypothetical protein